MFACANYHSQQQIRSPKVMFTLYLLNVSFHHCQLIPTFCKKYFWALLRLLIEFPFRRHVLRFEQHVCGKGNLPESNAIVSKSTAGAKACVAGVRKGRTWAISEMKFLLARAYAEGSARKEYLFQASGI